MASLSYSLRLYVESCLRTVERSARERIQETDCVHSLLYINPSDSPCNFFSVVSSSFPHVNSLHCIAPHDSPCNAALVASSCSHFHSLHCPMRTILQFLARFFVSFAFSFIALPHGMLPSTSLSSLRYFSRTESGRCTLGHPDPLETFQSLLSIIQPFGDMSCDRQVHHRCSARCVISMLNAGRKFGSRAISCT